MTLSGDKGQRTAIEFRSNKFGYTAATAAQVAREGATICRPAAKVADVEDDDEGYAIYRPERDQRVGHRTSSRRGRSFLITHLFALYNLFEFSLDSLGRDVRRHDSAPRR